MAVTVWDFFLLLLTTLTARIHFTIILSGQRSRGSVAEYQADEQAGVAGLSWRVSGR